MKRSKLVKGKLYEFSDLPIEISRAITETWTKKEGRDYLELLAGLWRWDGGGNWTMVKRVT